MRTSFVLILGGAALLAGCTTDYQPQPATVSYQPGTATTVQTPTGYSQTTYTPATTTYTPGYSSTDPRDATTNPPIPGWSPVGSPSDASNGAGGPK
jgi:hypothetical protein